MSPTKLHITVRTITGKEIELDIQPQFTILEIKQLIEVESGIPPDQQWIIIGGRKVDGNRTAADCKIEDGAVLNLVLTLRGGGEPPVVISTDTKPLTMHIIVRDTSGEKRMFEISPEYTLRKIKEICAVPFKMTLGSRLLLQGEEMSEDKTVAECGIKDGQILDLLAPQDLGTNYTGTSLYKTKACRFFAKGCCAKGDNCTYLHE